jgi:carboxyl-terminal processing protease
MKRPGKLLTGLLLGCAALLTLTGCDFLTTDISDLDISSIGDNSPGGIVDEAWGIIQRDYVEPDSLDDEALQQGAVRGMIEALDDPHSAYLDPEEYELSADNFGGSFEGIGATVGVSDDDEVIIVAPIPGSPADEAGVRAGDVILGVDGQSTEEMNLIEVVMLVRGPQGTMVTLTIRHDGETEPVDIEIIRDEITLESVYYELRDDTAVITITHFSEITDEELEPVLAEALDAGVSGIVLDLRSNSGGILTTVVDVTSRFLTNGVVLEVVSNDGERVTYPVVRQSLRTDLPTVVLVNEYSASGSEVLAGALQDYDRAVIAGQTTFGKGSVNVLYELSDGSGLYLTTARWLTPGGRPIEGEGITPDYKLDLEVEETLQWALDYLHGENN